MDYGQIQYWQPLVWVTLFIVLSLGETFAPFAHNPHRLQHFRRNMALTGINSILNGALRGGLAAAAALADSKGWGLLHNVSLPLAGVAVAGILLLDLSNYFMHRLKHAVPFLWRFHAVHHSDAHLDVTSGVRFHPGETLFSIVFQTLVVMAFGIPFWALMLYFLLLSAAIQVNHSNVRWPLAIDRLWRVFLVSPYMHKTHHSRNQIETDSNFADIFSFWDRIFGTYRNRAAYDDLKTGLDQFDAWQTVLRLLVQPFSR